MQPGDESPAGKTSAARSWLIPSLALVGVFASELALFCESTARHFGWAYPRWLDQLQYLKEAYGSYDRMRAGGLVDGAGHALSLVSPQGSLHGFLGMIAFSIGGPSRTSALAVNMAAFIALQAASFVAAKRVSGSYAFAWAAAGLLLALRAPWAGAPGSATDFRLDWMAACAYGVALAAAVSGDGFRSTRWAVAFGSAVGVALLTRYLTAVYFSVIYLALLSWFTTQPGRLRQCGHIVLSGLCAAAISSWAFLRARHAIYDYYWLGQFRGPDSALRNSHFGIEESLDWLGRALLLERVGVLPLVIGFAAAAVFCLSARVSPGGRRSPVPPGAPLGDAWVIVGTFLAVPLAVLLLHPDKPSEPLEIVVAAVVWMIVLGLLQASRRVSRGLIALTCTGVALAGGVAFVRSQVCLGLPPELEAEYRGVNALGDYLYYRAEESGLSRPRVAVTWICDGISAASFEILGRERHRTVLPFVGVLPTSVLEDGKDDVMARLAGSDFVCLVMRAPQKWPFDRGMERMRTEMRRWCEANMRHDGDMDSAGFPVSVYERPDLDRPRSGGVSLAATRAAALLGAPFAPPALPGPPIITTPETVYWTTMAPLHYLVRAAYSPVRFRADGLPAGISIDERTGSLEGIFRAAGKYRASITAENAEGSAKADVAFIVCDEPWDVSIRTPLRMTAGVSAQIGYSAFDSSGMLDFIDVSDLTTSKFIARIAANEDERQNLQGAFPLVFKEPGNHAISVRFVRYDTASGGKYVFQDRGCLIAVEP